MSTPPFAANVGVVVRTWSEQRGKHTPREPSEVGREVFDLELLGYSVGVSTEHQ